MTRSACKYKLLLLIIALALAPISGQALASQIADEIEDLSKRSIAIGNSFMQQSMVIRLEQEFHGKFPNKEAKEELKKKAASAIAALEDIENVQQSLKVQLSEYQGDDWDEKFGVTGIWRKLLSELSATILIRSKIEYYRCLTLEAAQRNAVLKQILKQIASVEKNSLSPDGSLLKAKATAELAAEELVYKSAAIFQLKELTAEPDYDNPVYYRARIERIKFEGVKTAPDFGQLTQKLAQSSISEDSELAVSLAILKRNLNYPAAFEETVTLIPQTAVTFSVLLTRQIENDIEQKRPLPKLSEFEADLAAKAILTGKAMKLSTVDFLLKNPTGQSPSMRYALAARVAESDPKAAIEMLINLSNQLLGGGNDKLDISPERIAKQAAQIGYNLFLEDRSNCPPAMKALNNYLVITGSGADAELEYIYTAILSDCGQKEKAEQLLQRIAEREPGYWSTKARLDIILAQISKAQTSGKEPFDKTLEELKELILNLKANDALTIQLRANAITAYGDLALATPNTQRAEDVLLLLDRVLATSGVNIELYRAKALQQLNSLDRAAYYMLLAIQADQGPIAESVEELLELFIQRIDEYDQAADEPTIENCRKLANYAHVSLGQPRSALIFAEISILAYKRNKDKLSQPQILLASLAEKDIAKSIDYTRCGARLLMGQEKFSRAADQWGKIANTRKAQSPRSQSPSWNWWRAKYYQLYCLSKIEKINKKDLLHNIDVLQNSYPLIPQTWERKLNELKTNI